MWELLGDNGDFADVFVVAAEVFGYFREHLFPSFKDLRPEWIVHSEHLCSAGGVCYEEYWVKLFRVEYFVPDVLGQVSSFQPRTLQGGPVFNWGGNS